jgi:putative methanogenesis marker protein 17
MAALDYFQVECPEPAGKECYERITADVLQDHDLIRVVSKLHIFVDPTIPLFIAVGITRKVPGMIKVHDFAQVQFQETQTLLAIGDETYLAPLLTRLWEMYGKDRIEQPDRFTVIIRATGPDVAAIEDLDVADPSEGLYKDLMYVLMHVAPEGFKVRRQYYHEGVFYLVASEDTLPEHIVETLVREKLALIGAEP